jgi:hypothetical protein
MTIELVAVAVAVAADKILNIKQEKKFEEGSSKI